MLGISQVRKKLELGPDNLPMTVIIADNMAHLIAPFEDDTHPRRGGTWPDRVALTALLPGGRQPEHL